MRQCAISSCLICVGQLWTETDHSLNRLVFNPVLKELWEAQPAPQCDVVVRESITALAQ